MVVALLKYPKKSHRKLIKIPQTSVLLAELTGIIFGDGAIGNGWQLVISLNSNSDLLYSQYISRLFQELFGLNVSIRKRPGQNTLVVVCTSTSLVEFVIERGMVRGNKITQQIAVPNWIKEGNDYKKAFVRGLVDTDGCLFIHKHTIAGKLKQNIGFCFTSHSLPLIVSVAEILEEFGIEPHFSQNKTRIYLYRADAVLKYLNIFGSSNPRILNKYQAWRDVRVD